LDAVAEGGCVNEVDREVVSGQSAGHARKQRPAMRVSGDGSPVVEVGVKTSRPAGAGPSNFPRRSIGRQPEYFKKIVHGRLAPRSADAERHEELSSGVLVERVQIDGAVTLVAQDLNQSRATFLRGWLQLPVCDPQEMHLEGLDEKIL
jgi:hypothetical protein